MGRPWPYRHFATLSFQEFFRLGRAIGVVLPLCKGCDAQERGGAGTTAQGVEGGPPLDVVSLSLHLCGAAFPSSFVGVVRDSPLRWRCFLLPLLGWCCLSSASFCRWCFFFHCCTWQRKHKRNKNKQEMFVHMGRGESSNTQRRWRRRRSTTERRSRPRITTLKAAPLPQKEEGEPPVYFVSPSGCVVLSTPPLLVWCWFPLLGGAGFPPSFFGGAAWFPPPFGGAEFFHHFCVGKNPPPPPPSQTTPTQRGEEAPRNSQPKGERTAPKNN